VGNLSGRPCVFISKLRRLNSKKNILAALTYFDLFNYPLTQTEICQFLQESFSNEEITLALQELASESLVFKFDDYYSLQDNYSLIQRRRKGNLRAKSMLRTAEKIAGFLSAFPFVKGVAVSGSLSKNYADEDSDIDFFIITSKNRLWLARTLMHCFKKLSFLFKKQDWFCMNYYIDETALQIREKNIYTAIEVATLLPLRGIGGFREFYEHNRWYRDFLPNHSMRISYVEEVKKPLIKTISEFVFNNPFGNLLDYLLMKLTARRWKAKSRKLKKNKRGAVMGMDCSKHYAKPDPGNFQKQLLDIYARRIQNLFNKHQTEVKSIF